MTRSCRTLRNARDGWLGPRIAAALVALSAAGSPARASVCGTAADEFIAAEVGLVREWIVQVPFDSAAWRLEHVVVGRDLVVAQSRDGGVAAIQSTAVEGAPRPGSVLWQARIGTPGGLSRPAGIGPQTVAIARDLDVYALDRASGRVAWREQLGSTADAPPSILGDWVYVPMSGQIMRIPVNPLRTPSSSPAADRKPNDGAGGRGSRRDRTAGKLAPEPLVRKSISSGGHVDTPVNGDENAITWTTTGGQIVALERVATGWNRSEFELGAAPVGAPAIRGRSGFAVIGKDASTPPTIARIDLLTTGVQRLRAAWWSPLPDRPDQGPFVTGDTVVVSLGPSGLAAYSAETGEPLWRSCVVGTIVAVGGERAWVIDEVGRLSGIDLASGVAREWLPLGCLTVPVINTVSDRLVLASPTGLVVSLAPVRPATEPAPAVEEPASPAPDATDPADPAAEPAAADPDTTPP
jgi:outer membrane protein assembly factor BamB